MNQEQFNKAIGRVILHRRTNLGLSQEALAARMGVTFQQIQKYERGKNQLSCWRLYQMASALETSTQGILAQAFGDEMHSFNSESASNREGLEIMKAFGRLRNPILRRKFSDLLRAVGDEPFYQKENAA